MDKPADAAKKYVHAVKAHANGRKDLEAKKESLRLCAEDAELAKLAFKNSGVTDGVDTAMVLGVCESRRRAAQAALVAAEKAVELAAREEGITFENLVNASEGQGAR